MAQGEILVEWKIDTVMNHLEETMSYYVAGMGQSESLTTKSVEFVFKMV